MTSININTSPELEGELNKAAQALGISLDQTAQLAFHYFLQSNTLINALEGVSRIEETVELVNFPELQEEFGLDLQFHPKAMEELQTLHEDEQIVILEEIINRVSEEESDDEMLDLVLKEAADHQIVISEFSFGDVVYQIGDAVTVHHIAIFDEFEDDDEDDDDEDFDEEDEDDDEDDIFEEDQLSEEQTSSNRTTQ